LPTTFKLRETRKRNVKALEHRWERINPNVRHLIYVNPNGIKRGTWMGHGDHGVVGTMDPHGDGDVMTGYKVSVTRVRFESHPHFIEHVCFLA
jgi:hypothetical protein